MKQYIPNDILDQNYNYYLSGSNILIVTNNNCYTNYNTTYCDCITYNPELKLKTETRSCSINQNLYEINYDQFINKDIYNYWNIIPIIMGLLFFIAVVTRKGI